MISSIPCSHLQVIAVPPTHALLSMIARIFFLPKNPAILPRHVWSIPPSLSCESVFVGEWVPLRTLLNIYARDSNDGFRQEEAKNMRPVIAT